MAVRHICRRKRWTYANQHLSVDTAIHLLQIPIRYVALETLLFTIYTIEAECWTFGIVLWELFSFAQRLPYEEELPTFSVAELKSFLSSGRRLNVPVMAPRPMYELVY